MSPYIYSAITVSEKIQNNILVTFVLVVANADIE